MMVSGHAKNSVEESNHDDIIHQTDNKALYSGYIFSHDSIHGNIYDRIHCRILESFPGHKCTLLVYLIITMSLSKIYKPNSGLSDAEVEMLSHMKRILIFFLWTHQF